MPSPKISIKEFPAPAGGASANHHSRPSLDISDRSEANNNHNTKQPPPRPPIRSNFELEPNPFEQSFSVSSSSLSSIRHGANQKSDPSSSSSDNKSSSSSTNRDTSPSRRQSMTNGSAHSNGDTPKTILPPLASITSPSDPSYAWAYSSASLTNSLRAGPLSPAMLAGPQTQQPTTTSQPAASIAALAASAGSMHPPLFGFDPSGSFRTGLTPSSGLTPLVGGPVAFPPPSPNTAAFLAMVNSGAAGNAAAATITPNTLNALAGVLQQSTATPTQTTTGQTNGMSAGSNGTSNSNSNSNAVSASSPTQTQTVVPTSVAPSQVAAPSTSYQNGSLSSQSRGSSYQDAAGAANHAANGLFLLSQAHQELTKREEAQKQSMAQSSGAPGRGSSGQSQSGQSSGNGQSTAKRGSKRKAETGSVTSSTSAKSETSKKPKASSAAPNTRGSAVRRGSTVSNQTGDDDGGDEDEDSSEDQHQKSGHPPSAGSKQNKKPETEEEKRRNFLERNRQAALKCRQRKKQWLAQLQAKNEYLQNENERLTAALVASREEISRLSQLVGGAGVGLTSGVVPMVGVAGMGVQQQQVHHAPFLAHQQQHHPVAVPVSLAQGSSTMAANATSPPMATKTSPHLQHHHSQQQVQHSPNLHSPTSDGRSSRSSFRDVRDYNGAASAAVVVRESGTRDYVREMRERDMGHVHGHAPQAVAVNGRTYGY